MFRFFLLYKPKVYGKMYIQTNDIYNFVFANIWNYIFGWCYAIMLACGWCFCHVAYVLPLMFEADVNLCVCHYYWLMLCQLYGGWYFTIKADVIASFDYISLYFLADVIAIIHVADVITTYCIIRRSFVSMAGVIAIVCGRC